MKYRSELLEGAKHTWKVSWGKKMEQGHTRGKNRTCGKSLMQLNVFIQQIGRGEISRGSEEHAIVFPNILEKLLPSCSIPLYTILI